MGFAQFAKKHLDLIEQFGRFPHRNEVLGRAATPEEMAYLDSGGERHAVFAINAKEGLRKSPEKGSIGNSQ